MDKAVRISLTAEQQLLIQPLFDEMDKINKNNGFSSVFAQVWDCVDGLGYIDARLIEGRMVLDIQKATGVEPGHRVGDHSNPVNVDKVEEL